MGGLSHYDDIEMRLRAISTPRTSLAACLVDAETWVAFDAIKHHRTKTGLVIRNPAIAAAMQTFIVHHDASAMVRRVLSILGDLHPCTRCKRNVFTIPLVLLRGLDSLRALACSICGQWVRMYWLPCGDDLGSIFGEIYAQHGLLHEIPIRMGEHNVKIQIAPAQYTRWNIAQFLDVIVHYIFVRNHVVLESDHLILAHNDKNIPKHTPLQKIRGTALVLSTTHGAQINMLLQHVTENIAQRFTHTSSHPSTKSSR
jgi:hypothetical protein